MSQHKSLRFRHLRSQKGLFDLGQNGSKDHPVSSGRLQTKGNVAKVNFKPDSGQIDAIVRVGDLEVYLQVLVDLLDEVGKRDVELLVGLVGELREHLLDDNGELSSLILLISVENHLQTGIE